MRDILLFVFVAGMLPYVFSSSFVAFLLWTWSGLAAINFYTYGFMRSAQIVQIFALITLMLLFMKRGGVEVKKYEWTPMAILFVAMLIHGLLAALMAYPGLDRNWELYTNMVKTVLLCLLMPVFLSDRNKLNLFVLLMVAAVSFHGLLDGLKFLSSGGGHKAQGLQKFGDNNHYALVLLMVMPLFMYVYRFSKSYLMRQVLAVAFVLTFLAVIATNSRGALIGVIVMGLWIILLGKKKIAGLFMAGLLAFLTVQLAPAHWFERMDTIQSADEDASFMGRVTAWKRASAIALENPVFGGGYHAGQGGGALYEQFRHKQGLLGFVETPDTGYAAASHSIYFEVLGDLGFLGLFIFLACIFYSFVLWRKVRALASKDPHLLWAAELSNLVAAGVVVYAVSGALLSAAYFELPYYMMMLMQVLFTLVHQLSKAKPLAGTKAV